MKTNFINGSPVTPTFLNRINNPVFSTSPSEDGEFPIPEISEIIKTLTFKALAKPSGSAEILPYSCIHVTDSASGLNSTYFVSNAIWNGSDCIRTSAGPSIGFKMNSDSQVITYVYAETGAAGSLITWIDGMKCTLPGLVSNVNVLEAKVLSAGFQNLTESSGNVLVNGKNGQILRFEPQLTGDIVLDIQEPVPGATYSVCFEQGASAYNVRLQSYQKLFVQSGYTGTYPWGGPQIVVQGVATVNAYYVMNIMFDKMDGAWVSKG